MRIIELFVDVDDTLIVGHVGNYNYHQSLISAFNKHRAKEIYLFTKHDLPIPYGNVIDKNDCNAIYRIDLKLHLKDPKVDIRVKAVITPKDSVHVGVQHKGLGAFYTDVIEPWEIEGSKPGTDLKSNTQYHSAFKYSQELNSKMKKPQADGYSTPKGHMYEFAEESLKDGTIVVFFDDDQKCLNDAVAAASKTKKTSVIPILITSTQTEDDYLKILEDFPEIPYKAMIRDIRKEMEILVKFSKTAFSFDLTSIFTNEKSTINERKLALENCLQTIEREIADNEATHNPINGCTQLTTSLEALRDAIGANDDLKKKCSGLLLKIGPVKESLNKIYLSDNNNNNKSEPITHTISDLEVLSDITGTFHYKFKVLLTNHNIKQPLILIEDTKKNNAGNTCAKFYRVKSKTIMLQLKQQAANTNDNDSANNNEDTNYNKDSNDVAGKKSEELFSDFHGIIVNFNIHDLESFKVAKATLGHITFEAERNQKKPPCLLLVGKYDSAIQKNSSEAKIDENDIKSIAQSFAATYLEFEMGTSNNSIIEAMIKLMQNRSKLAPAYESQKKSSTLLKDALTNLTGFNF